MDNNVLDKILIKVINIEEKMGAFATRNEMNEKFGLVLNNIDRFVKLHETLDQELVMLRNKYNRLEERIVVLEQKMQTV